MRYRDIILARALGKGKKGMAVGWPLMLGVAGGGGTETTITGVSPLLLAAALHKPLKSLTQYGLCTQADTPTPSVPVPIMCNNGALTMVDDELPIGYKRLTGIRFDGDTWYETGEALMGNDEVTMTLDNTAGQGQNVFGSYNGTASGSKNFSLFIYGNGVTSNSYFRYGEQLLRPRFGTGERTITVGKNGTDGFATDATATPDTFETPANAYIGMLPNSTSPAYTGDIKGNIFAGTRLKWIPCERAADGVIGYYEAVNGAFIAPSGTGTPTALGYDDSHYSLAVVGTDEVLTVSGKNTYNPARKTDKRYLGAQGTSIYKDGCSFTNAIPVEYGKTYTFSGISSEEGSNNKRLVLYTDTENPPLQTSVVAVTATAVTGVGVPYSVSITVNDPTAKYIRASFNTNDTNVMMEEGATATDYQPYVAPQTITDIPMLLSVGDYADEVEIISGIKTGRIGWHVFDGTETFGKSSAYGAAFYIQSAANVWGAQKKIVMCSHYLGLDAATSTAAADTCFFNASGHFYIRVTDNSDTAAFKSWLKEQYAAGTPVILLYALATETTESVTAQPLRTNEGDNIITVEANVSPIQLEATYMKGE